MGKATAGSMGKATVLLLTTTGRKSGKERTNPLIYGRDGESLVVIASRGGDDRHPAWYHNLKANPQVSVNVDGKLESRLARDATDEERGRLWEMMVASYADFDSYQRATKRKIPVVVLD